MSADPSKVASPTPKRVEEFAQFFKRYMSVSSVVAAALPIPVTQFKLIPIFQAQAGVLSVYTPLFCFLLLAFIFSLRHLLARLMFPIRVKHPDAAALGRIYVSALPVILILACMLFAALYQEQLTHAVAQILKLYAEQKTVQPPDEATILKLTPLYAIPHGAYLMTFYVAIFATAETSFVLMAIREYLQDLMKLSEMDLIHGPAKTTR